VIAVGSRSFDMIMSELAEYLSYQAQPVESQTWQSQSTEGRAGMRLTWELEDVALSMNVPGTIAMMAELTSPNLPWADVHFTERVAGDPVNPPPSHAIWPHRQQGNQEHLGADLKFSHTYPERYWPTHAGHRPEQCGVGPHGTSTCEFGPTFGVRYEYGDLFDVVNLLDRDPTTRQAYLPVWFPEDTGAMFDQRVPCTLGYWFRIRKGHLHCTYHMRSCDYLRHMRDDVYLAMRLMDWICNRLNELSYLASEGIDSKRYPSLLIPGRLTMNIGSLHIFDGDRANMKDLSRRLKRQTSERMMGAMG
jgi:hypothetical protein